MSQRTFPRSICLPPPPSLTVAVLCMALVWAMPTLHTAGMARADDSLTLEQVIANVAANEALFENLEIVVERKYELVRSTEGVRGSLVQSETTRMRSVFQSGMVFASVDRNGSTVAGRPVEHALKAGYDGTTTRVCKDGVANIQDGRDKLRGEIYPHMLLLEGTGLRGTRLSEYLSMKENRRGDLREITVDGLETIDGLRCVKLRIKTWGRGEEDSHSMRHLWLAMDRHYFPARTICYATGFSAEIPLEESAVLSWTDVEPGITCPERYEIIGNYSRAIARGHRTRSNRSVYQVQKVDLNPQYPIDLFRNIPMPDGTAVFEIGPDNEVERGRIAGAPLDTPARRESSFPMSRMLVLFNLVAVLAICLIVALRRRQRRASHTPAPPQPTGPQDQSRG